MTWQQETDYIHAILNRLYSDVKIFHMRYSEGLGYDEDFDVDPLQMRMESEGLVIRDSKTRYIIYLTAKGRDIARFPSGYRGYLASQQEKQEAEERERVERLDLDRMSAHSTRDAAESAKHSTKWAKISGIAAIITILVSIGTTIYQQLTAEDTQKEVDVLKEQVKQMEQRLAKQAPTTIPAPGQQQQQSAPTPRPAPATKQ